MNMKEAAHGSCNCARAKVSTWLGDTEIISGGWTRGQCRAVELSMTAFWAVLLACWAVVA